MRTGRSTQAYPLGSHDPSHARCRRAPSTRCSSSPASSRSTRSGSSSTSPGCSRSSRCPWAGGSRSSATPTPSPCSRPTPARAPTSWSCGEPVTLRHDATPQELARALAGVLDDPAVDSVVVTHVPMLGMARPAVGAGRRRDRRARVEAGRRRARRGRGRERPDPAAAGATTTRSPSTGPCRSTAPSRRPCVALQRVTRYAEWRARPLGEVPELDGDLAVRARDVVVRRCSTVRGTTALADTDVIPVVVDGEPPLAAVTTVGDEDDSDADEVILFAEDPEDALTRLLAAYGIDVWPVVPVDERGRGGRVVDRARLPRGDQDARPAVRLAHRPRCRAAQHRERARGADRLPLDGGLARPGRRAPPRRAADGDTRRRLRGRSSARTRCSARSCPSASPVSCPSCSATAATASRRSPTSTPATSSRARRRADPRRRRRVGPGRPGRARGPAAARRARSPTRCPSSPSCGSSRSSSSGDGARRARCPCGAAPRAGAGRHRRTPSRRLSPSRPSRRHARGIRARGTRPRDAVSSLHRGARDVIDGMTERRRARAGHRPMRAVAEPAARPDARRASARRAFGGGLTLALFVVYLHQVRGFSLQTAGLVLTYQALLGLLLAPLVGVARRPHRAAAGPARGRACGSRPCATFAFGLVTTVAAGDRGRDRHGRRQRRHLAAAGGAARAAVAARAPAARVRPAVHAAQPRPRARRPRRPRPSSTHPRPSTFTVMYAINAVLVPRLPRRRRDPARRAGPEAHEPARRRRPGRLPRGARPTYACAATSRRARAAHVRLRLDRRGAPRVHDDGGGPAGQCDRRSCSSSTR